MARLPDNLPPGTQAAFERLRQVFLSGLQARWAQIDGATNPADQAAALHRLAGAAGSYALDDIDVAARLALHAVQSEAGAAVMDATLAALQRSLREAGATI